MKKLTIMFAIALLSVVSIAGYASANEGTLNTKANADVSMSAKPENQGRMGLLHRMKDRIEAGLRGGVVTQVNTDGSFNVESKNGTKAATVKTDASTTFTKDGQPADKTAVVVGAKVGIKGTLDKATSTITAKAVHIIDKIKGMHFKGTVTALSGTTITVKNDAGVVYSIDASKAKVFHSFWFGTSGDVKVGDTVAVWGTQIDGSNTITARWIRDISIRSTPSPTPVR